MIDLDKSVTEVPGNDFSVPLIAVLLALADKDVVQTVVRSPSLLARLVQYTSKNMKARSVTMCDMCVSVAVTKYLLMCVSFIMSLS